MYLSQLHLNPRNRKVQRDLAQPYDLHRTIMKAFPDELPPDERVLFRLEEGDGFRPFLLVQSQHEPDWTYIMEKLYLYQDPYSPHDNPAIKPMEIGLRQGQQLHFRLCANPTVKRDGKRRPLYKEEDQKGWLLRKSQLHGFQVKYFQSRALPQLRTRTKKITLHRVQFDGVLQVADVGKIETAVASGIGPGKAFGCGLLSLAPCR